MSQGFVHSIKVPRLYKTAATIVKKVAEDGASLKQLIYEKNHPVSLELANKKKKKQTRVH